MPGGTAPPVPRGRDNLRHMVAGTQLSHVFPLGSRLNERGRLEVGGCDVIELAREFGTPAYVVAEDDLRARARAFLEAGQPLATTTSTSCSRPRRFPAPRSFSCSPRRGCGATSPPAASCTSLCAPDSRPSASCYTATPSPRPSCAWRCATASGLIVLDNLSEIERLEGLIAEGALADRGAQPVMIRVTPGVSGDTHEKISTGQAASKFGFGPEDARAAIARVGSAAGLELVGLHAHIGSQLLDLDAVSPHRGGAGRARSGYPVYDLGGGLGVAYTAGAACPRDRGVRRRRRRGRA